MPVNKRHLDMVYSHIRYSDKPFMGSVTAPERARDTVEMARLTVRRGLPRGPHGHHLADQRQLAARLGLGDARRRAGLRRGQPGDAPHAVHPGRRDGPGDRGRRLRPDPGRGARRDDLRPARPAGRAGRPRLVRQLDVDAVGRADVRDARAGARPLRDGRPGPPARRPVPLRRLAVRLEDRRRPGRLRVGGHAPADRPRRRQLRAPRGRLARGRARPSATRSSSSTPTSAG